MPVESSPVPGRAARRRSSPRRPPPRRSRACWPRCRCACAIAWRARSWPRSATSARGASCARWRRTTRRRAAGSRPRTISWTDAVQGARAPRGRGAGRSSRAGDRMPTSTRRCRRPGCSSTPACTSRCTRCSSLTGWRPQGDTRETLQGLIQIAVGYQHLANGNRAGARSLLVEGSGRLHQRRLAGVELDPFARAAVVAAERVDGRRADRRSVLPAILTPVGRGDLHGARTERQGGAGDGWQQGHRPGRRARPGRRRRARGASWRASPARSTRRRRSAATDRGATQSRWRPISRSSTRSSASCAR